MKQHDVGGGRLEAGPARGTEAPGRLGDHERTELAGPRRATPSVEPLSTTIGR